MGARPPRESAHLNGRKGSLHWQRQKARLVLALLPAATLSLPRPLHVMGHGVRRATGRRYSPSRAHAHAARAVSLTSSRTERGRERPREDDARCGSDSPEMVASLECGEVEINDETGVPFRSPILRA